MARKPGPFPQLLLDVNEELIVDLFAGGGGASLGIELATGRQVDVAVNHDPVALSLHRANHPQTRHVTSDVFEVDPREVTEGRPVGLLWASPDCTDHSKAKGGKPFRDSARKRRALAWVVTRWAGQVRPRVIMLENVEEFAQWGPLVGASGDLRRCPKRKGQTFRAWVRSLEGLGYVVEWRELRACDYGAPTIRKRLFVVARCDGKPIVWPKPTHGPTTRKPYRTAAECIDWSVPMLSIFATREEAIAWGRAHGVPAPRRPLAEKTMRRIARGVQRFVVEAAEPFIVTVAHGEESPSGTKRWGRGDRSLYEPFHTVTASPNQHALIAPYFVPRYGERDGQEPRTRSLEEPAPVIVPTGNGGSLVAAHLSAYYGLTGAESRASSPDEPVRTITADPRHAIVASFLARHWGGMVGKDLREPFPTVLTKGAQDQLAAVHMERFQRHARGAGADEPLGTVRAQAEHHGVVASFLQKYYGEGVGSKLDAPSPTLTAKDRLGLVTVMVAGEPYVIVDIAMRMLAPHELFLAQGFPGSYEIRRGRTERGTWVRLTKTSQVRLVGNSVPPDFAREITAANCPELVARDEVAA